MGWKLLALLLPLDAVAGWGEHAAMGGVWAARTSLAVHAVSATAGNAAAKASTA